MSSALLHQVNGVTPSGRVQLAHSKGAECARHSIVAVETPSSLGTSACGAFGAIICKRVVKSGPRLGSILLVGDAPPGFRSVCLEQGEPQRRRLELIFGPCRGLAAGRLGARLQP